jgi:hypothetical protein
VRARLKPAATIAAAVGAITIGAPAAAATQAISVDLTHPTGTVNRGLVGFDYHPGAVPLKAVAPLHPRFVRIDASLQDASPNPATLNLAHLLHTVAEVRAIGGEPLVILSYTPAWLGQALPPIDRTRNPPTDLAAWRKLIERTVQALATAPAPAYWFEAWNEPDLPIYWTGTVAQWSAMATATGEAIDAVRSRTGLPLHYGGPASFIPDPLYETAFNAGLTQKHLPVGFISWHYYGNYPCIGPDGPESPGPAGQLESLLLGCRNPLGTPDWFTRGVAVQRAVTNAELNNSPPLILDEWNLSAGGLDRRMGTNVGAAFDAATLMTLQAANVDDALFYQATDTDSRPGGWGAVNPRGEPKPAFWTFAFWQRLRPTELALTGAEPSTGVYAIAARDQRQKLPTTILLTNYAPAYQNAHRVDITLAGLPIDPIHGPQATVARIDQTHTGAEAPTKLPLAGNRIALELPPDSVALITVTEPPRASHHR